MTSIVDWEPKTLNECNVKTLRREIIFILKSLIESFAAWIICVKLEGDSHWTCYEFWKSHSGPEVWPCNIPSNISLDCLSYLLYISYAKHQFLHHIGDGLALLRAELKGQKKQVKHLKKKSLWSRSLEEVTLYCFFRWNSFSHVLLSSILFLFCPLSYYACICKC